MKFGIWSTSRDYILELIVFQAPFLEKLDYLKYLDELDLYNPFYNWKHKLFILSLRELA
jgi:hypothetical protein